MEGTRAWIECGAEGRRGMVQVGPLELRESHAHAQDLEFYSVGHWSQPHLQPQH